MISDKSFRVELVHDPAALSGILPNPPHSRSPRLVSLLLLLVLLTVPAIPSHGRVKKAAMQYGAGLIVNIPLPEPEVAQVVEDVAQNSIIRGTREYNKDEYLAGAVPVTSTPEFPPWKQGGKVFYKVRKQALDPQNFKDSGDLGTLAVRYVVQPQGDNNTILRIDAVFVEDFRRVAHQSNGSVESSEYKDIQERLGVVELMKKETAEALEAKQERADKEKEKEKLKAANDAVAAGSAPSAGQPVQSANGERAGSKRDDVKSGQAPGAMGAPDDPISAPQPAAAVQTAVQPAAYERQPGQSLEQHVAELRREVERLVKKPGAPLQSAPFHTATTLKSLEPGTEVLILISTPYWYGVETRDGEHGWIRRDQLEQTP